MQKLPLEPTPRDLTPLDLTTELRLRRWAREHYAPPSKRCATWHPVVLDEMRRRDVETAELTTAAPRGAAYVPLSPVTVLPPPGPGQTPRSTRTECDAA